MTNPSAQERAESIAGQMGCDSCNDFLSPDEKRKWATKIATEIAEAVKLEREECAKIAEDILSTGCHETYCTISKSVPVKIRSRTTEGGK